MIPNAALTPDPNRRSLPARAEAESEKAAA